MKKITISIMIILLWSGISYGIGNIHLGPLGVYPSTSISETYIDNLFLTTHDKKDDSITTFTPGVIFKLPLRRHSLNIEYRADILRFSDYDELDRVDKLGAGYFEFDFPGGLNIRFGNRYYKTARLPDFLGDWDNPYYTNNGGIEISYKFADKYKIKFSYAREKRVFDDIREKGDNYDKDIYDSTIFYRILPKTSILLEYILTRTDNVDLYRIDNDVSEAFFGIAWDPTAKLRGTIKIGYTKIDYDTISDKDDFDLSLSLEYQPNDYTLMNAEGYRKILETSATEENAAFGRYYVSTGFDLSLSHKITYKISLISNFSFIRDVYPTRPDGFQREDNLYRVGLGVDYKFRRWIGAGLKYQFSTKDSTLSLEDYDENRVIFNISSQF
jgi:hypothetical protein